MYPIDNSYLFDLDRKLGNQGSFFEHEGQEINGPLSPEDKKFISKVITKLQHKVDSLIQEDRQGEKESIDYLIEKITSIDKYLQEYESDEGIQRGLDNVLNSLKYGNNIDINIDIDFSTLVSKDYHIGNNYWDSKHEHI